MERRPVMTAEEKIRDLRSKVKELSSKESNTYGYENKLASGVDISKLDRKKFSYEIEKLEQEQKALEEAVILEKRRKAVKKDVYTDSDLYETFEQETSKVSGYLKVDKSGLTKDFIERVKIKSKQENDDSALLDTSARDALVAKLKSLKTKKIDEKAFKDNDGY